MDSLARAPLLQKFVGSDLTFQKEQKELLRSPWGLKKGISQGAACGLKHKVKVMLG